MKSCQLWKICGIVKVIKKVWWIIGICIIWKVNLNQISSHHINQSKWLCIQVLMLDHQLLIHKQTQNMVKCRPNQLLAIFITQPAQSAAKHAARKPIHPTKPYEHSNTYITSEVRITLNRNHSLDSRLLLSVLEQDFTHLHHKSLLV